MPKKTVKYIAALTVLRNLGEPGIGLDAEHDYDALAELGYQWDAKKGKWINVSKLPSQPASTLLRIRVWAAKGQAHAAAMVAAQALHERAGWNLLEESAPYPCRPPQQNDERVYLTFGR
jgi:hypothetical protein